MFGMLDYRAHKLYKLLFFIPGTIVTLFSMFGLPLIEYSIGIALADNRLLQILISLGALVILEIIWLMIVCGLIGKSFQALFDLIVDIVPCDGRSKEEAQLVVWNGDRAIRLMKLSQNPTRWSDELIRDVPKADWVQNMFYRREVISRLEAVRLEYQIREDYEESCRKFRKHLEKYNLVQHWTEKLLCEQQFRRAAVGYAFLACLFILHPV